MKSLIVNTIKLGMSLGLTLILANSGMLSAQSHLISLEAQGVAAYTSANEEIQFYSHHPHDAMQRPSLGFDYVGRFGGATRDIGYLAIQARLAYAEEEKSGIQPQLYNAFFNWKAPGVDIWLGHNKPALGLSSYLDNHALLLVDNSMSALNFDRDWGLGMYMDRDAFNLRASVSTGSGMPLYIGDNHLIAMRAGFGDLARENHTFGVSLSKGKVLRSMGYYVMHNNKLHDVLTAGADASLRWLDWDVKADILAGEYDGDIAYAALGRVGKYLLPEDRMLLEVQALASELKGTRTQDYSLGLSWQATSSISLRGAYTYSEPVSDHRLALQLYYLKSFPF